MISKVKILFQFITLHTFQAFLILFFVEILKTQKEQNRAIMEVLANQTVLIKTLVRQESEQHVLKRIFPINDEIALENLNGQMNEENIASYVSSLNFLLIYIRSK